MTANPSPSPVATVPSYPPAHRLEMLRPYPTALLEELKQKARDKGRDIIDLGIGSPDQPTPQPILEAMARALQDTANHRYPAFTGKAAFRQAVAAWYNRRFGVTLDPDTEVLLLVGSKEGLAHLPLALLNPGDASLVPDPSYPVHIRGTLLAGGEVIPVPLHAANGFVPDLKTIDRAAADRAKLFFFNYPNNPTAGVVELGFFEEAVAFARQHSLLLVSDLAYSELAFDGFRPPSILQAAGAKEVAVEFHSLSKTYNMAGWRIGFAVGNAQVLQSLYKVKTNYDYGLFGAIQDAGIAALELPQSFIDTTVQTYQRRRDVVVDALVKMGCPVVKPKASMYVWAPIPQGYDSSSFSADAIDKTGVAMVPGSGFGPMGEGYFRISLVTDEARLQEAMSRLAGMGLKWQ